MSRRAVILAGGRGTRLKPYTVVLPKPLMPVGEYPILEIVVRQLVADGFDHLTFAVNHQADIIMAFFGDGSKWGTRIDYSLEDRPLSTMGPLRLIKDLPEHFLIMNGDVLTDMSYATLYNDHTSHKHIFTISAHERTQVTEYGVLETDDRGVLVGFKEKPAARYLVSMGVYVAHRSIVDYVPRDTFFGFDHLMAALIDRRVPVSVRPYAGWWLDIGRPDDYAEAVEVFEKERRLFLREPK